MRKILPLVWLGLIYFLTVVMEGHDPSPPLWTLAWLLFELRHALTHLAAFGIQVWLVARAVHLVPARSPRDFWVLLALGVILGSGLEAIQAGLRAHYSIPSGLWDVFVDGVGAAVGWWFYQQRIRALSKQPRAI